MKIYGIPIDAFGVPFNKFWKRVLIHFGIEAIFACIMLPTYQYNPIFFLKLTCMAGSHDVVQGIAHFIIFTKLDERYDWMKNTKQRILYGVILHFTALFVVYFVVLTLIISLFYHESIYFSFITLANLWVIPFTVGGVSLVLSVAIGFFVNWKKSLASESKIQADMMNYKYESLRNQINPHFLLDSFSLLKKLVYQDQDKAVMFIQKISDLYRHVLEVKDKEFILLIEELRYVETYTALLKLRYENRLDISINLQEENDDLIAPLALQLLIENAVENNLVSHTDLLKIEVAKQNDHIIISNSRNSLTEDVTIISSSLKNLEQQYQFYSKKPVEFLETSDTFSVKIPILKHA